MDSAAAFAQFYEANKDPCLRAVTATGRDRASAEEAVAEAFSRAWASWHKVRLCSSPTAWVIRVALNHQVSRWRRLRRETELQPDHTDGASWDRAVDDGPLLQALALLPERQRQVVVLRVLLDFDTRETAQALSVAPGTVTAHLHRALAALRASQTAREACS